MSPARWDDELKAAGFSGAETIVYDDDEPYQLNQNIVSRRTLRDAPISKSVISILKGGEQLPGIEDLEHVLAHNGYQTEYYCLGQSLPTNQDIISVIDLSESLLDNICAVSFAALQKLASESKSRRILWLTRSSQIDCCQPQSGLILGLSRALRAETSIDFTTLELDKIDSQSWNSVLSVFQKFEQKKTSSEVSVIDPDYEFVLRDGIVLVGRYNAVKVPHELPALEDPLAPKKLKIGKLGLLQTLTWEQQEPLSGLGAEELELEPQCVGLNFRVRPRRFNVRSYALTKLQDVLSSMGIIDASKGGLGLEASGVVRAVGSAVVDFAIGDRVIAFKSGCFSTRMHISAKLCAKIPDSLSNEEAATMPTVYSTVIHSLINLGSLQRGQVSIFPLEYRLRLMKQTVLIHSACGGVGLAAIQVCEMLGASVSWTISETCWPLPTSLTDLCECRQPRQNAIP